MRRPKRVIDAASVYNATAQAKHYIGKCRSTLRRIDEDPDREKRLKRQECGFCHYMAGKIGGAAVTTAPCGICDRQVSSGNTCIAALCLDCAKRLGLCKHCGGDIEMKHRRKPRDFSKPENSRATSNDA